MVTRHGKVPAAALLGAVLALGCGGDARSAEEPAGADVLPAAGLAEATVDPREAASRRARTGADPRGQAARAAREPDAGPTPEPPAEPEAEEPRLVLRDAPAPDPDPVATAEESPPEAEPVEAPRPGLVPEPARPDPEPVADGSSDAGPELPPTDATDPPPAVGAGEAPPGPPEPAPLTLDRGTRLAVVMEQPLSTRSTRAGDVFFGYVEDDVLTPEGMVLVPFGARVRGRVVDVRPSGGPNDPAILELAVEALIDDGRAYPLVAHVVDVEMEARAGESTGRTAAKIGVGAAAGAILGKLLGKDTESAVAGAIAGAAAGTAAALSSKDGHAEIPEGSVVIIELDLPVDLGGRF